MSKARLAPALALILTAPLAAAQTPSGGPPPSPVRGEDRMYVRELVPDIGQIGAQVGILGAVCMNPYDTGAGPCGAGFIALPLARVAGGRLWYEIDLAFAFARSDPFTVTNALAYVANLAAGATPAAAAAGPPSAPFPVRREVRTDLRLFQVSPFALRYAFAAGPVPRLRPYLSAGIDIVVVITEQQPVRRQVADPLAAGLFDETLIAGLAAQAPELTDRGVPSGQGNLRLGGHAGLGAELRVAPRVSINGEYRFALIEGAGSGQHAVRVGLGLHW